MSTSVIWQLHTQDLRSRLEMPGSHLISILDKLTANAGYLDIAGLVIPESECYGFKFTDVEFSDSEERFGKVKKKKMVPIEVNHGQVEYWEKGWEKFKRPDFVIRDISSFIEREGNYTSFLNE